jgi:hypothetical protein
VARTVAEDVILMQAGLDPHEGGSVSMAWRIRKKSREVKTVVGRNELRGDAVQSGQGGLLFVRGQRKFNREQENPRVRGEVGIANPFGSVVSSQESTTPSNSYLSSIIRARPQHLKKAHEPSHRVLLIANLVHRGNSLSACSPSLPRLPQGLP